MATELYAADELEQMRRALVDLLGSYLSLANSGDAGFWDPEEEPVVIAARAALRHGR